MKYILSFNGGSSSAVVIGDKLGHEDVTGMIVQAINLGAGCVLSEQEVRDWFCDVYELPHGSYIDEYEFLDWLDWYDLEFIGDAGGIKDAYVDLFDFSWNIAPPNARLGLIEGNTIRREFYKGVRR